MVGYFTSQAISCNQSQKPFTKMSKKTKIKVSMCKDKTIKVYLVIVDNIYIINVGPEKI